jgi:hypothetical protein
MRPRADETRTPPVGRVKAALKADCASCFFHYHLHTALDDGRCTDVRRIRIAARRRCLLLIFHSRRLTSWRLLEGLLVLDVQYRGCLLLKLFCFWSIVRAFHAPHKGFLRPAFEPVYSSLFGLYYTSINQRSRSLQGKPQGCFSDIAPDSCHSSVDMDATLGDVLNYLGYRYASHW